MSCNLIHLKWSNSCDLGGIYYGDGFVNEMFLQAEISKPEYLVETEGFENGDGVFVETRQVRKKIYVMQVFVSEPVADALVLMALHDTVRIKFTNGLYEGLIRNIQVEVAPEDDGCMSIVTIKFQQDDQVVDTSCCTPLPILECLSSCGTILDSVNFDPDVAASFVLDQGIYLNTFNQKLYYFDGDVMTEYECTDMYALYDPTGEFYIYDTVAEIWRAFPQITTITNPSGNNITVTGFTILDAWVDVYKSTDDITYTLVEAGISKAEFEDGYTFNAGAPGTWYVKVNAKNKNCDYGYSLPDSIVF